MLDVVQFISNWVYCHGRNKIWKRNKLFPNFYQVKQCFKKKKKKTNTHTQKSHNNQEEIKLPIMILIASTGNTPKLQVQKSSFIKNTLQQCILKALVAEVLKEFSIKRKKKKKENMFIQAKAKRTSEVKAIQQQSSNYIYIEAHI